MISRFSIALLEYRMRKRFDHRNINLDARVCRRQSGADGENIARFISERVQASLPRDASD